MACFHAKNFILNYVYKMMTLHKGLSAAFQKAFWNFTFCFQYDIVDDWNIHVSHYKESHNWDYHAFLISVLNLVF